MPRWLTSQDQSSCLLRYARICRPSRYAHNCGRQSQLLFSVHSRGLADRWQTQNLPAIHFVCGKVQLLISLWINQVIGKIYNRSTSLDPPTSQKPQITLMKWATKINLSLWFKVCSYVSVWPLLGTFLNKKHYAISNNFSHPTGPLLIALF